MRSFQDRVRVWVLTCFGVIVADDKQERSHRFLEEALEVVQASGMSEKEARLLVKYVYRRPVGELNQEVGGAMVCLAALCSANGIVLTNAGEQELARVWTKIEQIREKQRNKPVKSPLPE
jgi:NTP pyrophosphatase (non-canonical NTP hydrolase)